MKTTQEQNKALVLEAFDTLFNRRDYDAAARFWSPAYIQHSAHIAPGRDGLFALIKSASSAGIARTVSICSFANSGCAAGKSILLITGIIVRL